MSGNIIAKVENILGKPNCFYFKAAFQIVALSLRTRKVEQSGSGTPDCFGLYPRKDGKSDF
jgi:hypothetical protein